MSTNLIGTDLPPNGTKPWGTPFRNAWDALVGYVVEVRTTLTTGRLSPQNLEGVMDGYINSKVPQAVEKRVAGMRTKIPVRAATTAAGNPAVDYAAGKTVDGVTLVLGDRFLIKDGTNAALNGIVIITNGTPERAGDANTSLELSLATVTVAEGTVNAGRSFVQLEPMPVVGTTGLIFKRLVTSASVTQAEYDALPTSLKQPGSGTMFVVTAAAS